MNFDIRSSLLLAAMAGALTGGAACTTFFERPTSPLLEAAWDGDVAAIRTMVSNGASLDETDNVGGTALYWAARGGHPLGPHRCDHEDPGRPEVVATLLELGADPNIQDRRPNLPGHSSGWTPLVVALHHRQFASATLLLDHQADPNLLSDQGMSVMDVAVAEGAPADLLALILRKGFDPALAHERASRPNPDARKD